MSRASSVFLSRLFLALSATAVAAATTDYGKVAHTLRYILQSYNINMLATTLYIVDCYSSSSMGYA